MCTWARVYVCAQACVPVPLMGAARHKPTCALPLQGGGLAEEEPLLCYFPQGSQGGRKPPFLTPCSPDCDGPCFLTQGGGKSAKPSLPHGPRRQECSAQRGSGGALLYAPTCSLPLPGPQVPAVTPSQLPPMGSVTSTNHPIFALPPTDEESKAQRDGEVCPRSHSQEAADPNPGLADSHSTTRLPEMASTLILVGWALGVSLPLSVGSSTRRWPSGALRREEGARVPFLKAAWGAGCGSFSHRHRAHQSSHLEHLVSQPDPVQASPWTPSLPTLPARTLLIAAPRGAHLVALGHSPPRRHQGPATCAWAPLLGF